MIAGNRAWKLINDPSYKAVRRLCETLGVVPIAGQILASRGLEDPKIAARFLRPRLAELPKPTQMAGMPEGLERLARAVQSHEKIAVFGDYDADGVTSSALVLGVLKTLGVDARSWLANRFGYGYGLSPETVEEMHDDGRTTALILDCGTSDFDALSRARERGIDAVVVDHHPPSGELPPALAVINPLRQDCPFPDKGMATVGLAFYLMASLRTELNAKIDVRDLLDLVAVGTVADVAPLQGVNRILVRRGLHQLDTNPRPGLSALCAVSKATRPNNAQTIGFKLGPRLNAAGRLGKPDLALELLMAEEPASALRLAQGLDELSSERRTIQDNVVGVALPHAQHQAEAGHQMILVGEEGWHQGVVGIVASRLCEELNRPAAVVSFEGELGRGSARSPRGLDLHAVLMDCAAHLIRFGGHAAAAGFSVHRDRLEALHAAMDQAVAVRIAEHPLNDAIPVDVIATERDLTLRTVSDLDRIGPFGEANPEPIILVEGLRAVSVKPVRGGHLSLRLECGSTTYKAFWPMAEGAWPEDAASVDALCHLRRDAYRGREQVELRILDIRPST